MGNNVGKHQAAEFPLSVWEMKKNLDLECDDRCDLNSEGVGKGVVSESRPLLLE